MLWTEPFYMIYAGLLGGMFGGLLMTIAYRRSHREYRMICERLWTEDILKMRNQIHALTCEIRGMSQVKISTKIGDKAVHNDLCFSVNEGCSLKRQFDHGV